MAVRSIVLDDWEGVLNNESEIDAPTERDIEEAVERLDANRYTQVLLFGCDDSHMAIGGGAGRYVAYVTFDNAGFHQMVGDRRSNRPAVLLNVGGQEGEYAENEIVSKADVIRAAKVFAETNGLDPSSQWMEK